MARRLRLITPLAVRFWAKVEKTDGCWLWQGAVTNGGYGAIEMERGGTGRPHRVSWEINVGPIPDGMYVCHHCDVKRCVRPDHLFLGTHLDNMRDAATKGRMSRTKNGPPGKNRGSTHGMSKLTETSVLAIRERWATGESGSALAESFGVSSSAISMVVRRHRWRHI